jgi:acyl-CoA synthetase (AMP-forming)/AMP-acid ligase II
MQTESNVVRYLLDGARPERIAIRTPDRNYSYGDLLGAIDRVSAFLLRSGAQPRDRVLLLGENSLFWVACYLGAMRAGLVCAPLPPTIAAAELRFIRESTAARIVCMEANTPPPPGADWSGVTLLSSLPDAPAPADTPVTPPTSRSDLAALMFTSGSTGAPRGVMISHGNLIANTASIVKYLGLAPDDRMMTVLPFHYCYGASLLHTHVKVGACLVVEPRFMYPETLLQRLAATECTGFAGVPSHYQILLRNSSIRKKSFPSLRYVQQAGGALAPAFVQELQEALPHVRIFVMYGQTEATARLSYLPPEQLGRKLGSIGKGIPGVRLRVLDESGAEVAPGAVGEIVAEGENVALGYWNEPEQSAVTFRNGLLYTGDLATVDADGYIYIVDRARDFIKCGGERVGCRKIEEVLAQCEAVVEAAVLGMPDPILGEAVRAIVTPADPDVLVEAEASQSFRAGLLRFCKERLPASLVPKEIHVVTALPKNTSGKVLKRDIQLPGTAPSC